MHECKTVTLRTRPLKGRMLSFYLDYYPGYRDKETMKVIRHETLGIYLYADPKNKREQNFNEVMTEKAEAIRCRRFESVVNERYDFFDKYKLKADFLEYFRSQLRKHDPKWEFVYLHFRNFVHGKCTFEEIDIDLCNKFREYLLTANKLKRKGRITRNSASGYWSTFRGLLKILYRNGLIKTNVNDFLDKIETEDVVKDYLSVEELYKLAETPCKKPVLKTASLFSCMTSLRISDILALCWEDIVDYSAGGKCVHIVTQKNRAEDIIPISEEALDLIGYSPDKRGDGLQGVAALLDPDLHEGVDPLGGYHQEHLLPLLSQNICDAAGGGRDRHPYHTKHHGAQEYYHHPAVYQGSGCQQTGSQQKNHPDAEEVTGGFRPGWTDKVRFLFENRTKRVIVSVTAATITLFFVTIRNYDYNFTSVTITNSCGYG